MCAFGAHSFKEISRSQLVSAAKFYIKNKKRDLGKAEKMQLVGPLASVIIDRGIVVLKEGATFANLSRNDVTKVKPF